MDSTESLFEVEGSLFWFDSSVEKWIPWHAPHASSSSTPDPKKYYSFSIIKSTSNSHTSHFILASLGSSTIKIGLIDDSFQLFSQPSSSSKAEIPSISVYPKYTRSSPIFHFWTSHIDKTKYAIKFTNTNDSGIFGDLIDNIVYERTKSLKAKQNAGSKPSNSYSNPKKQHNNSSSNAKSQKPKPTSVLKWEEEVDQSDLSLSGDLKGLSNGLNSSNNSNEMYPNNKQKQAQGNQIQQQAQVQYRQHQQAKGNQKQQQQQQQHQQQQINNDILSDASKSPTNNQKLIAGRQEKPTSIESQNNRSFNSKSNVLTVPIIPDQKQGQIPNNKNANNQSNQSNQSNTANRPNEANSKPESSSNPNIQSNGHGNQLDLDRGSTPGLEANRRLDPNRASSSTLDDLHVQAENPNDTFPSFGNVDMIDRRADDQFGDNLPRMIVGLLDTHKMDNITYSVFPNQDIVIEGTISAAVGEVSGKLYANTWFGMCPVQERQLDGEPVMLVQKDGLWFLIEPTSYKGLRKRKPEKPVKPVDPEKAKRKSSQLSKLIKIMVGQHPKTEEPAKKEKAKDKSKKSSRDSGKIPIDKLVADKPPRDKSPVGKPPREKLAVDKPPRDKYPVDRPAIDKPSRDKYPVDKPAIDKPSRDKYPVDKHSLDKPSREKPAVDKPSRDKYPVDKHALDKPSREKNPTDKPPVDKTPVDKPSRHEKLRVEPEPSRENPAVQTPIESRPIEIPSTSLVKPGRDEIVVAKPKKPVESPRLTSSSPFIPSPKRNRLEELEDFSEHQSRLVGSAPSASKVPQNEISKPVIPNGASDDVPVSNNPFHVPGNFSPVPTSPSTSPFPVGFNPFLNEAEQANRVEPSPQHLPIHTIFHPSPRISSSKYRVSTTILPEAGKSPLSVSSSFHQERPSSSSSDSIMIPKSKPEDSQLIDPRPGDASSSSSANHEVQASKQSLTTSTSTVSSRVASNSSRLVIKSVNDPNHDAYPEIATLTPPVIILPSAKIESSGDVHSDDMIRVGTGDVRRGLDSDDIMRGGAISNVGVHNVDAHNVAAHHVGVHNVSKNARGVGVVNRVDEIHLKSHYDEYGPKTANTESDITSFSSDPFSTIETEEIPSTSSGTYTTTSYSVSSSKSHGKRSIPKSNPRRSKQLTHADSIFEKSILAKLENDQGAQLIDDDIAKLPQRLVKLEIPNATQLTDYALKYLPESLTILDLQNNPNFTDLCIAWLPKTLKYLNMNSSKWLSGLCFKLLPPDLEGLELASTKSISDRYLIHLPKSLVFLNFASNQKITDKGIPLLPKALRYLDLSSNKNLTDKCISKLPSRLTYLNLQNNRNLSDAAMGLLPSSLTHLNLSKNPKLTNKCINQLPVNLRYLNVESSRGITQFCVPHLPRFLEYLYLHETTKISDSMIYQLPRTLKTVRARMNREHFLAFSNAKTYEESPSAIANDSKYPYHIASKLVALDSSRKPFKCKSQGRNLTDAKFISRITPELNYFSIPYAPTLTEKAIAALPRHTTYLDLSFNEILNDDAIEAMPPGLCTLNLRFNTKLTDACIPLLPRTLTFLDLGSNDNITDNSISDLPKDLLHLNLNSNTKLTNKALKKLPIHLTHLNLSCNPNFTDEYIIHLPRKLLYLNLAHSLKLTDACIELLPKNLVYLNLRNNKNLTDAAIPKLPRSLTELDLSKSKKLTNSCIEHLPDSLSKLEIPLNKKSRTTSSFPDD